MSKERVRYEKRGHTAWITINRPESFNALTLEMIDQIRDSAAIAEADEQVRVLVVTGTGRSFCPGFDINLFRAMGTDMNQIWDVAQRMLGAWTAIRKMAKPTIAALNGATAGGGFELALSCDLRIAASTAKIGSCEVRINQPTTNGSSYLLARTIGEGKAKELCLTGDTWTAEVAERFGLVNAVAESDELQDTVQSWADRIASRAPIAVNMVKGFFEESRVITADAAVQMEEMAAISCCFTEDQQEGFNAFLEKRPANWAGK